MNATKNQLVKKRVSVLVLICLVYGVVFVILTYWPLEMTKEVSSLIMPIISEYDMPFKTPTGLAYDGEVLWVSSPRSKYIVALDPENGDIIRNITNPVSTPWGLAWDGSYLWIDSANSLKLYQINTIDGSVISSINAPGINPSGLTWDGSYLWVSDFVTEKIYQVDPSSGMVLKDIDTPIPGKIPTGLAWYGAKLWVSDVSVSYILEVDPVNNQVDSFYYSSGYFPGDITWAGNHLWVLDYSQNKIFETLPGEQEIKSIYLSVPSWFFTIFVISTLPVLLSIMTAMKSQEKIVINEKIGENSKFKIKKRGMYSITMGLAIIGSMYTSYELLRIIYNVVVLKKLITMYEGSFFLYRFEMFICIFTLCYWFYFALLRLWKILSRGKI